MKVFVYHKFMRLKNTLNSWFGEHILTADDNPVLLETDELAYIESFAILNDDGSSILANNDNWIIG